MKIYKILLYTIVFAIISFSIIFSYILTGNNVAVINKPDKKRIVLLSQVYQNPYWQKMYEGAQDAANNRGCAIEYSAPQTPDIKESLKLFDMAISAKVDGIIAYVQEDKQFTPYINKAVAAGIPVITVDTDAKKSKRMAFVGTNNIEAGNAAGQKLAEITYANANIGIIMSGQTTTSQLERVQGFSEYISSFPGMKIVQTASSNSDVIEAELVAKKMILENPKLTALYCTSSVDGIGAARAVLDTNKKGKISIVCFDDLPETLDYIKSDVIQVSIVQRPYQMGYDSVNYIMNKLEGKQVNGEFLMGIIIVTKENLYNYNIEYTVEKGEMN